MLAQAVIELEASERIGADKHERTRGRSTYRNGYRERVWDTRVGRVNLKIPKLREGSFFPELLQPRRRSEQALLSVIQEAYVHGVSTRDELVKLTPSAGGTTGSGRPRESVARTSVHES